MYFPSRVPCVHVGVCCCERTNEGASTEGGGRHHVRGEIKDFSYPVCVVSRHPLIVGVAFLQFWDPLVELYMYNAYQSWHTEVHVSKIVFLLYCFFLLDTFATFAHFSNFWF